MVSYKLDKYDKYFVAFILVILVIFNLCTFVYADEEWETVEVSTADGIWADESHNYFYSSGSSEFGVSYFPLEVGYIYRITVVQDMSNARSVVGTSEIPSLNVEYNYLSGGLQHVGDSYSIIGTNSYGFIAYSPSASSSHILVERQKVASMNSAVGDLVSGVGPQQLWSVFESGIDFVGVVVLVAFGLFLIVLLIKKLSKGKSDF